jgi:hypothetical protein
MEQTPLIGYTESEGGTLTPLFAPGRGSIVTHAFILCSRCGGSVYHCMGPRYDAVCLTCAEKEIE